jgi:hypothetical protein
LPAVVFSLKTLWPFYQLCLDHSAFDEFADGSGDSILRVAELGGYFGHSHPLPPALGQGLDDLTLGHL